MHNELPADWPQVTEGITIHWHGLDMRGAEFYDGVAYLHQCPIAPGTNFTYRFTVRRFSSWDAGGQVMEQVGALCVCR